MTRTTCPPLLVFADDWGRHPSSCQHLVRHLLTRHDVWWVNTIGTRPPRLDGMTLRRGLEKARQWSLPKGPVADEGPPNPRVLSPRMWPWFRSSFDRRLNRGLLLRQLRPILEALPEPAVAVTTIPIVADLTDAPRVARWVYYCVDDFGQWPGLDRGPLGRMERLLVERADTLIAASEVLRSRLAGMGRDAHLLTHGVDLGHWAAGGPPLSGIEGLPRPLVVFWGVIDRRLDVGLLAHLSSGLTSGTIVLVGPEQDPDPALDRLDRVVRHPPLPYASLPGLAREAAALIMPYADLPVTRSMQPLKLKEYLATGRPVIVSDLPSTRPWSDCLDIAGSPGAFVEAVRARISGGTPVGQRIARGRLEGEEWGEKALMFGRWALGRETVSGGDHLATCLAG